MKLFELAEQMIQAETLLEEWAMNNEGVIDDFPLNEELEKMEMDFNDKALSLATWIKNLKSDSTALSNEIKALTARKTVNDNKMERIRSYLSDLVPDGQKLENSQAKIGWSKSSSVSVTVEAENLPEEFKKVAVSADKVGLKLALKNGHEIPGVSIVTKQNLQIK